MYGNYFRIAKRKLIKNKIFSFINVFGLAVGFTCCMLIAAFLLDELSYDKFPDHAGQIYRVEIQITQNGGVASYPDVDVAVGPGIKNTYPEVLASTRITGQHEMFVRNGDKLFKEQYITFCDSNFLQIFSIRLLDGDNKNALTAPNSIVITNALEKKYFGDEPALGKTLTVGRTSYKITGIIDKV